MNARNDMKHKPPIACPHLAALLLLSWLSGCGGGGEAHPDGNFIADPQSPLQQTRPLQQQAHNTPPNDGASTASQRINSIFCPLSYYITARPPMQGNGTDPFLAHQWYLNNTGRLSNKDTLGMVAGEDIHVQRAWEAGFKGEGIRIAIIDDSIETTHQDLYSNVVADGSWNYLQPLDATTGHQHYPVPCDTQDDHGTQVAGIIAARDNNGIGISGVAPRAGLVGLNALANHETGDVLDALTRDAERNDIYNNSWGANDWGHFYAPDNEAAYLQTLDNGLRKGRHGQGSIYTFAAGNGAASGDYSPLDGNVSSRGIITICATNAAGKRAPYSERGPNLTVCAPSADLSQDLGLSSALKLPNVTTTYLQDHYTDDFNGTSAATPMVSGVIALMLQANPSLTWRDVPLILARTARQVDPTSPGWRSYESRIDARDKTTSAYDTLHYSHEYGFGVVNAEAAIKLARNWTSIGNSNTQKRCGPIRVKVDNSIPEALVLPIRPGDSATAITAALVKAQEQIDYNAPAPQALTSTIDARNCPIQHIEHIDVTLTATDSSGTQEHPGAGDLHITLTSPSGSVSTLTIPHPCKRTSSLNPSTDALAPCSGLNNYTFGVRRHLEEPVIKKGNGNWTLSAVDRVAGHTGKLKHWQVTFYGR